MPQGLPTWQQPITSPINIRLTSHYWSNRYVKKIIYPEYNRGLEQCAKKHQWSYYTFPSHSDGNMHTIPTWYLIGQCRMSIAHAYARLWMLCAVLNDHLYSYIHVVESPPVCQYGHFRENNMLFYILDCPLFTSKRVSMFHTLGDLNFQPIVRNLLYGNTKHSELVNGKTFEIMHSFHCLLLMVIWLATQNCMLFYN